MRILYDGLIYKYQVAGGINRYFSNIIRRLPEMFVPFLLTSNNCKINYPDHPNLKVYGCNRFSFRPGRIASRLNSYYCKQFANFKRPHLAHPTYYSLLTGREIGAYRCPVVITVWDMIHELFSKQMDPSGQQAEEKRQAIRAAQTVLCISESTKNDLLERLRIPESRVKVTYLASEIDESMAFGSEPVPSRPYYLYVGSRAPYKNFDGLLSAIAKVISLQRDVALCVVGSPLNKSEEKLIADLRLDGHIEHYGYTSDRHLAKLYRCSVAFVYPSFYEGFGIPPLEAMACGTAVVASNCSSVPEVVGDAGLLFNPKATDDLADILVSLLNDSTIRERLIGDGYRRSKLFTWDKTAAQTLGVYCSLVN